MSYEHEICPKNQVKAKREILASPCQVLNGLSYVHGLQTQSRTLLNSKLICQNV